MKEKKDLISLLHKIYVAGYEHGDNQGSFPEIGMFDAFNRLIVGESPLLDGCFYDIKDKVDEVLSKFNSEDESPYCPICTGCGEEGCCSPLNCTQNPNGSYCQTYLRDLKFGYKMYNEVSELIKDDPKYKDDVDVIFDKVYNEIYGEQFNIDNTKSTYSIEEVRIMLEKQRYLTASSLGLSSAVYIYPKDYTEMKELMVKTPLVI